MKNKHLIAVGTSILLLAFFFLSSRNSETETIAFKDTPVPCPQPSPCISPLPTVHEPTSSAVAVRRENYLRFQHNPELRIQTRTTPPFIVYIHDPSVCLYISGSIKGSGVWDAKQSELIRNLTGDVAKGALKKTVLDVGANLGWFTLLSASLGHNVIAIEPLDFNLELLKASRRANEGFEILIEIHKAAVTDNVTFSHMCMKPAYAGNPSQNQGNGQLVPLEKDTTGCSEIVPMTTIDAILGERLEETGERVYLMKMDIEGFETRALRGARNLLEQHRPCHIIFEHLVQYVMYSGVEPTDIFLLLADYGYFIDGLPLTEQLVMANLVPQHQDYHAYLPDSDC